MARRKAEDLKVSFLMASIYSENLLELARIARDVSEECIAHPEYIPKVELVLEELRQGIFEHGRQLLRKIHERNGIVSLYGMAMMVVIHMCETYGCKDFAGFALRYNTTEGFNCELCGKSGVRYISNFPWESLERVVNPVVIPQCSEVHRKHGARCVLLEEHFGPHVSSHPTRGTQIKWGKK